MEPFKREDHMGRGGGYEKTLPSVVPKQENVIYAFKFSFVWKRDESECS